MIGFVCVSSHLHLPPIQFARYLFRHFRLPFCDICLPPEARLLVQG